MRPAARCLQWTGGKDTAESEARRDFSHAVLAGGVAAAVAFAGIRAFAVLAYGSSPSTLGLAGEAARIPFLTGIEGGRSDPFGGLFRRGAVPGFEAELADDLPLIEVE